MKRDIVKKYIAHDKQIRVILVQATQLVSEAKNIHQLSNVATAALGRTMIASTILSSMLTKPDHRLTLQIKGDGPLGTITVCSDANLNVKGYVVNPSVNLPLNEKGKLDVSKAVGNGFLTVIKEIGMDMPYLGTCKLVRSEIAEDFAYYFVTSEQRPCIVSLGVQIQNEQVVQAAGYFIEPLPGCPESILTLLENKNKDISSVTNLFLKEEFLDNIATIVSGDDSVVFMEEKSPKFYCDCNKERMENVIISLGKEESNAILKENNEQIEMTCQFCHNHYTFNKQDIIELFKEDKK